MIKIGLTGNIGSGKTTVAKMFETLGVPVFYADIVAKKFLLHDAVINQIVTAFGDAVLDEQGKIINSALGVVVFSNKEKLQILNNIIHPRVREAYNDFLSKNAKSPYTIQEAAILIESGFYKLVDKIVLVKAPEDIRLQRVMKRDNLSEELVKDRMQQQLPEGELEAYSDYVVDNNGINLILPQVIKIDEILKGI